jgi:hypothetical protein
MVSANKLMDFVGFKFVDASGMALFVGSDKPAHFFAQGYEYYARVKSRLQLLGSTTLSMGQVRMEAIRSALLYGYETEVGTYGMGIGSGVYGTGIFSFADLATNAAGLGFWMHLKDRFMCVNGRWRMMKEFKWEDYVTPAWDGACLYKCFFMCRIDQWECVQDGGNAGKV